MDKDFNAVFDVPIAANAAAVFSFELGG